MQEDLAKIKKSLKKASVGWKEWKDLKGWEKTSKVPKETWKKLIFAYAFKVVEKALGSKKKNQIDYFLKATDERLLSFLHTCLRRVYLDKYVKKYKPSAPMGGSAINYLIFIVYKKDYFDWGNKRYNATIEEYGNGTPETKVLMEQEKTIDFKRDQVGNVLETVPRMRWGKAMRDIPKHAYVADAVGVAMPEEDYVKAIADPDGEDSVYWSSLMPCTIELNSDVPRNLHYGDPDGDKYIDFEQGKCYKGSFFCKRGKKVTVGDKTLYLYEGEVTSEEIKDAEGVVTGEVKKYSGQRSFQYDLGPNSNTKVEEIPLTEFNVDDGKIGYFYELAYDTWGAALMYEDERLHGLASIPRFFSEYSYKSSPKKPRIDALHAVAFEADVLEAIKKVPQEGDRNQFITRRLRLDDGLDGKIEMDSSFTEISIGCNNLSEKLNEEFDKLAEQSRIKIIVTLKKDSEDDLIGGECIWFETVKSSALADGILTDDLFNIEEDDIEMSLLDGDDSEETDEFDTEESDADEEESTETEDEEDEITEIDFDE